MPRIDDPSFVSALVFDRTAGDAGRAEVALRLPVPSKNAALIQIRLRPDLTRGGAPRAIDLIRAAIGEQAFRPREGANTS